MARRSWKRNGVKGYAVGGMPDGMDPAMQQAIQGYLNQTGRTLPPPSAVTGPSPQEMARMQADARLRNSMNQRMPPQQGMTPGVMANPKDKTGIDLSGFDLDLPHRAELARASLPSMPENVRRGYEKAIAEYDAGRAGMSGQQGLVSNNGAGLIANQGMDPRMQQQGMPQQGMDAYKQAMQGAPSQIGSQGMQQQGMDAYKQALQGAPSQIGSQGQQGMDSRMQQMQQQAMQMAMQRQQAMQRAGLTPRDLPSAEALKGMPASQVREVLGKTLLGPQGYQQLQRQAMQMGDVSPRIMNNGGMFGQPPRQAPQQQGMVSNNAGGMMGQQPQQRSPFQQFQQASGMGQPPQQRSPFQQGIGGMGAAASGARVGAFADGGSVDSRMAELDRYLSDPNLKMVRTKSGKFQFVPINQPAKRKAAAPKPAAKPMAKAAPKSRAAANEVPGRKGTNFKPKTGGGGMKAIQRPLSAFTGSKVKPVKPTGMKKSTPLPRDMTGVNQTPIRGRDIAGSMAKGALMAAGPGMARAGVGMLGKGIEKGLKMARKPLTESRMSNVLARARPGEVVPRLPGSAKPASLGSKTARMPKASEYKSPSMKTGAAKRASEALKKRNVTAEEAMDMMQGYRDGGLAKKGKPVPRGYHRMPDGRVMKNSAHKRGRK